MTMVVVTQAFVKGSGVEYHRSLLIRLDRLEIESEDGGLEQHNLIGRAGGVATFCTVGCFTYDQRPMPAGVRLNVE